jgi:competence protein ComEA
MKSINFKIFLYITYGVLCGVLVAGLIWLIALPTHGNPVPLLPTPTPGMISVYVSGAVMTPGVYELPEGSRVEDAVLAAGGFAPGAEEESINLAAPVEDGEQIDVPGIVNTSHVNAGRVNINTASTEDLNALPGIGPTTAQAIVDYRLEHGPFAMIQDIQNVPGVGPATFENIKDYITTGE